MASYGVFADYYDSLTENVEYLRRAEYITEVFERLNHNMGLSLQLVQKP